MASPYVTVYANSTTILDVCINLVGVMVAALINNAQTLVAVSVLSIVVASFGYIMGSVFGIFKQIKIRR